MNKTYYIFRHGETFATKGNGLYWHKIFSAPILEEGKPTIIKLAEYLRDIPSDFNVVSPFLRCQQTAAIVTQITGKEFSTDRRIREYTFEIPWLFKKRIISFIKTLEQSSYQSIIICTHSIVIEMLIQFLVHGHVSLTKRMYAPLPGVLSVIKGKDISTFNFNAPSSKRVIR